MINYVYPGHPLTIACYIMENYSSLSEARSKGIQHPKALEDSRIPGAGGNVYAALEILAQPVEESVGRANQIWQQYCGEAYADRYDEGMAEAASLASRYRELREKWRSHNSPAT